MKIKNPNNLPVIDYRVVKDLQGNLKDLNKKNYEKLKNVLLKRGFDIPLFLWNNGDDHFLMDGHQRLRVMTTEDMSDDGNYEVPYILIEAADHREARAKLLEITSQYGKVTYEGFEELIADLPLAEIYEAVAFDALPMLGRKTPDSDPTVGKMDVSNTKGNAYSVHIGFNHLEDLELALP